MCRGLRVDVGIYKEKLELGFSSGTTMSCSVSYTSNSTDYTSSALRAMYGTASKPNAMLLMLSHNCMLCFVLERSPGWPSVRAVAREGLGHAIPVSVTRTYCVTYSLGVTVLLRGCSQWAVT